MLSGGWRWPLPIFQFCRYCVHAQARQRVLAENVANSARRSRRGHHRFAGAHRWRTHRGSRLEPIAVPKRKFAHVRSAAGRQRREPGRRDDEGGRQPDGFLDGDRALHAKPESHQDRALQTLNTDRVEGNVGSFEDADHRSFGPGSGGPHAHHFRKHCQCGLNTSTRRCRPLPA